MRVAFFDCVGGASGDMLLGALLDAGASLAGVERVIQALGLPGCSISVEAVMSGALAARQVTIHTPREETERHATELIAILAAAELPEAAKAKAIAIIERLAQVEAQIHGATLETVHLHEIGGDDTLIDIAGVLNALDELGIERVYVSPLPLARGMIQTLHGWIPLPAPATLALLGEAPVRYVDSVEAELVTPTGAAILTGLADGFGELPAMQLKVVGTGAGRRKLPFPNVVRVWIGETQASGAGWLRERLEWLETNIDDLNPQVYGHVMERLFAAGALDVTLTPIQMKKNRPAVQLGVLCQPEQVDALLEILFNEGLTLGVRRTACERISLPRRFVTVETVYGPITMKVAEWQNGQRATPEYEDCRRAAIAHGVPLLEVFAAAGAAYRSSSG